MIKSTAIIGMGALGLLYADQITTGLQDMQAACFVMDKERMKRHKEDRYVINGQEKHFIVADAEEASPADLVIVAVKYNALPEALETMKNVVGKDTIIISVMNGVTSEKIIAQRYGMDRIIYTVALGMDAMRDESVLRYTQCGKLHIGAENEEKKAIVSQLAEFFERAKVPYFLEENILYRLWFKYMLNVGINQTCMIYDLTYGQAVKEGTEPCKNMVGAMREVILASAAEGITLTEEDIKKCFAIWATLDPDGYPSMAQDRKAKRKSEVGMFAGEIIRKAKSGGFEVPYNQLYYNLVMEIESKY